ncbi:hypothetical protein ES703_47610 [subsurface metagenome]
MKENHPDIFALNSLRFRTFKVGIKFLLAPEQPLPGYFTPCISSGSAKDCYKIAADTRRNGRIIEIPIDNTLMERFIMLATAPS